MIADVSSAGIVTASGAGSTTIQAASGTVSAQVNVAVVQVASELTVSADRSSLAFLGDTVTLIATVVDAGGAAIPNPTLQWLSSDVAVATVDAAGLVTAIAAGTARFTAVTGSVANALTLAIEQIMAGVTVPDDSVTVLTGEVVAITPSVVDAGGSAIGNATVAWSSSDPSVAVVTNGNITGVGDGATTVTVEATLGSQAPVSVDVAVRVYDPIAVGTATLPHTKTGDNYSVALSASGGDGTYAWAVTTGTLPPGLTLSTAGAITGVASSSGSNAFTIEVTTGDGQVADRPLAIDVYDVLAVTTVALPSALTGSTYSEMLTASGGDGANAWTVAAGSIPNGLSLAADGTLSGNAVAPGSSTFTAQVASGDGQVATQVLSLEVYDALAVTTVSLPTAGVGAPYSETLVAAGGDGTYSWTLASGSLPSGMVLSTDGTVSGTSLVVGVSAFTVEVTSGDGQVATRALSIEVSFSLAVTTSTLPSGLTGTGYSEALAAVGGSGGYTWSVTIGSLPSGLTLSGGGTLSGAPSIAGTSVFTVQVSSGDGQTATRQLSVDIYDVLQVATTFLPSAVTGQAYNQTLSAVGGDGQYDWSVSVGTLPGGLTLDG